MMEENIRGASGRNRASANHRDDKHQRQTCQAVGSDGASGGYYPYHGGTPGSGQYFHGRASEPGERCFDRLEHDPDPYTGNHWKPVTPSMWF